jgi:quercetin dioxygenase-like cupin family protein
MLNLFMTETCDIEPVTYEWGAVKWVANQDVAPGCSQSFGIVHILPGKTNPEHWHTAAEELVYMLQGECEIRTGTGDRLTLVPGRTLFIPVGVRHELVNTGWEPVVYVCSFSASLRGTLFEDPTAPGARPVDGGRSDW